MADIEQLEAELESLGKELSDKQRLFVDSLLADPDKNATKAYKINYPNSSDKACESGAARLLRNAKVLAYKIKAMEVRSKETRVDANWLLQRLANEADADLADIYHPAGGLKDIHEWPKIWRQGLVAGVDVEQLFDYEGGEKKEAGVVVKVRLSDRVKRLEMIGKHVDVQAFKERIEQVNKNININATIDENTDSKTASLIYQDLIKQT